jgi:hypothetical protein
MLLSLLVSAICGYLKKPHKLFFVHLLSALVGCTAFFFHGFEKLLGFPMGDFMVFTTVVLCFVANTLYYIINPVDSLEVLNDQKLGEMQIGEKFFFVLSLRCADIPIPPGSYFNIYIYQR